MNLIDFSQIYIANIFQDPQMSSAAANPTDENRRFLKHMAFNVLRSYTVKYSKDYGKLVIACDTRRSWRKDVFAQYKASRKKKRDESNLDWVYIYSVADEIKADLKAYFPYPVIEVEGAEADDIIGGLSKHAWESENDDNPLFGSSPEKVMILSSDHDFFSLHKYKNVSQFSPAQKKLIKPPRPAKEYLVEKIIRGDPGDGIPNIKSPDNSFVDSIRQKPIKTTYVERLIKDPNDFDEPGDKERYARNERLISFDFTPPELYTEIVASYEEQKDKKASKMKLMEYLLENQMNLLYESIGDFYK